MKKLFIVAVVYCLLSCVPCIQASYVLPYPSYMPGNKLYKVSRIVDALNNWWYRGNIAQVKYHLNLSDKYLVEAKTLFEYKQYLLGADAMKRSTKEYCQIAFHIKEAKSEGKNMEKIINTVLAGGEEHLQVITNIKNDLPQEYRWIPEKGNATDIAFDVLFDESKSCIDSLKTAIQ